MKPSIAMIFYHGVALIVCNKVPEYMLSLVFRFE